MKSNSETKSLKYGPLDEVIPYLKANLRTILADGETMSEYLLLKRLREDDRLESLFDTAVGDPLALYRAHFLLFHTLYILADELAQAQQGLIDISPLTICLREYQPGEQRLTQADAVRDYYLDWRNYEKTGAKDVEELIASFWIGMHRLGNRDEALAVLGLTDPVDDATIRKAYQRLAMQHHPDRGGDEERIQAINAAVNLLLK